MHFLFPWEIGAENRSVCIPIQPYHYYTALLEYYLHGDSPKYLIEKIPEGIMSTKEMSERKSIQMIILQ